MRKLAVLVGITIILALLALFIAPQFIPADVYKEQVIAKVEQATGREMQINGNIGLRFIPNVQLTMEDVQLANPDGFDAEGRPMMTLRELQISLSLLDILQGRVSINTFKLLDPTIRIARNAKGEANWVFTPEESANKTAPRDNADASGKSPFRGDVQLPNLEISNGIISYKPDADGEATTLSKIDARISLPSLHRPMTIKADTQWNGNMPVSLEATIDNPAKWMDEKEISYSLALSADGKLALLESKGTANPLNESGADSPMVKGDMKLAVESLKKLGDKLSMPLLPDNTTSEGKFGLQSMFSYQEPALEMLNTTLSLDDTTLTGKAAVNLGGSRPALTASLSTADIIKLDDFLPKDKPSVKAPSKDDAPVNSVNSQGWSDSPLLSNNDMLTAADADITLNIGGIKADKLVLGAMQISAALKNGTLTTRIPEFAFYGGKASANATVKPVNSNGLSIQKNVTAQDADIGQFLRDAYDFKRLSGRGNLQLALATQGISIKDFVSTLGGNGEFRLQNGAIRGFNLAETVREARSFVQRVKNKDFTANMRSEDAPDAVKTDFSAFSASFTMDKGVATNKDLSLQAPLLTVTGEGTVDIPRKTVDYRLRPTVVGSIEGEGRAQETSGGLTIPMRVTGSFDALKFTPDAESAIENAIRNPKEAVKDLENNVRGLRDDMKSLFNGL